MSQLLAVSVFSGFLGIALVLSFFCGLRNDNAKRRKWRQ